ncbi:MAG TPA: hypothetical protein PLP19_12275 [bacterium]|nr:hypothetical protein [bacterium]HPN44260.1 hypothetical protein [bacterium]
MRNGFMVVMTVCLLALTTGFAQEQKIQVGLFGAMAKASQPQELTQKLTEGGLEISGGYVVGAKARYAVNKSLSLVGLLRYGRVKGDGEYVDAVSPYTGYNEYMHLVTTMPYFSLGAGVEYEFLAEKVVPYLSLCVLANNFAQPEFERTPGFINDDPLQSYSRLVEALGSAPEGLKLGLSTGMGFRIPLNAALDMDVNILYNWLNVAGNKENTIYNVKDGKMTAKATEKCIDTLNLSLGILYHL